MIDIQPLKTLFGFEHFRQGQAETIENLLLGHSSLAIFPTGSGKSLCYQFTATQLPHLTLVVSPLLALMKDQLAFLHRKGIAAASIDSSLTPEQNQAVMQAVRAGETKILMVSVERFKNERFRHFIESIAISMLVVDEAHCISEWGHNFRPDYLKLPSYQAQLKIPLVLLLTATATAKVKRDMATKFAINPAHVVQTGFYRQNLDLAVLAVNEKEKETALFSQIQSLSGAGIVYVTLQQTAERVAAYLASKGVSAVAYHAGFDNEKRQSIQNQFMAGQVQVVVATIAFGMGIDKADIRFVLHFDLPKSIENYSQEIGRAGRDGQLSHCITLANLDGMNTVENFVYGDTPELASIESLLKVIATETEFDKWELQINSLSNATNIKQLPLKTLLVQLELRGVIKPLYSYFASFKYKFLRDKSQVLSLFNAQRQAFLQHVISHSHFKKIWGEVNFDSLSQAYQYPRDRIIKALEYLNDNADIELQTTGITDVYQVDKQALQALLAVELFDYFHDKEEKEIARIATLIRFFELKKCLNANLARYFDDKQAPEQCGHCSVCRQQPVKLGYSVMAELPSDEMLSSYLNELQQHLMTKLKQPDYKINSYTAVRFLAGLTLPLFSRNRVRALSGFASCEQVRYQMILNKVEPLLNSIQ